MRGTVDLLTRFVFRLPNYVSTFGLWHGVRLMLQLEPGMVHHGTKEGVFDVPGYPRIVLRNSVSDRSIFWQCLVTQQYRLDQTAHGTSINDHYDFLVSSDHLPLIIDAGANIGLSSLYLHRLFPRAQIVCIEPDGANLELLKKNTAVLARHVDVLQGAVWDRQEDLRILDPTVGSSAIEVSTSSTATGNAVTVFTIDEILNRYSGHRPFIIKLDIEGAQEFLFRSNTDWINSFDVVILELDDWQFPWRGTGRNFFRAISRYDFDYVIRGESIFCFRHRAKDA
ncbi:MAG: FkbM family methyltransferase [Acetobacteraceae bacterium]|jgi:FkbM family methyltransferase|nr:FkbM family methyltransferase [Acetobacteraceae bacterium]